MRNYSIRYNIQFECEWRSRYHQRYGPGYHKTLFDILHEDGSLSLNSVNGFSKSLNITGCDARNRETSVLCAIDRVLSKLAGFTSQQILTYLLCKLVHLLRGEAGIGEHANLVGNVAPVMLRSEIFQVLLQ
jgi:hypothetical protein